MSLCGPSQFADVNGFVKSSPILKTVNALADQVTSSTLDDVKPWQKNASCSFERF